MHMHLFSGQDRPDHRRRRRHRPRRSPALPRRGRAASCSAARAAPSSRPRRPSSTRAASASLIHAGQITDARAGAGARRRRRRALRRRRRARQQHRHLPPRPVRRADRGALRGGARLDPAADLLGLPGRRRARCASGAAARSSTSARCGRVDAIATTPTSAYSAAQAGRHALTKNLAIELAADNIRVNTVALAFVETPAYERFMTPRGGAGRCSTRSTRSTRSAAAASPPTSPRPILFLAGGGAGWITGTTLPVDGGVLAGRTPAVHAEVAAA